MFTSQQSSTKNHLILSWVEFSTWQFEEGGSKLKRREIQNRCNKGVLGHKKSEVTIWNYQYHLQQKDMRQAMLMHNEDPINGTSHSKLVILVSHPLESSWHRGVLLEKGVFGAKCVV